ncbi:MAG: sugar porter family MFS transporter [Acidobacteriota bacterium]|jgi:SP family galactose:H+ symporter-like MFS transporter|nr:sugar porter family MFS transporter [Acidobacteriota bacterium]
MGRDSGNAPSARGYKTIVFVICIVAALGGLLFGLDQGFINNALPTLSAHYNLEVHDKESYSAILATGGVIGALLSGLFARFLGRKKSLVMAGFIFCAASAYSALLPSLPILSVCRFALGFGVGVASFIVPLYLSETAPASIRGSMGTLFQLMITIGIFLISVTNVFIARAFTNPENALPLMFLTITFFAAFMFFGSFFLPESPRWLMLKGRREQAVTVLRRTLNTEEEIDREINEIAETLQGKQGTGRAVVVRGYFIKVLLVGVLLQMFQQLVGINMMIYYSTTIFGYAGMAGLLAMMTVPTVNMLFTFPAIHLVEKWGRKKLLYVGAAVMLVTMLMAGFAFQSIGDVIDPALIGDGSKALLLGAVILYIFGFAVSWGPVAWLVCSEIFPLEGREVGMTITTMVNWTFAGLVMNYALSFMAKFGNASIFYLFAGFCVLAILFVSAFVPETKGVTLEEIEANLKKGVSLRNLGAHK